MQRCEFDLEMFLIVKFINFSKFSIKAMSAKIMQEIYSVSFVKNK